jgi:radical SAM superfamily enzyme YgiQ (UPF0313 family)
MLNGDDFSLLPWPTEDQARSLLGARREAVLINRGCPYACSFCISNGARIRYRDPGEAVAYLRMLDRVIGPRTWFIQDDIFAVKTSWLEEFVREKNRPTGTGSRLRCFIDGRTFNEERLDLLRRAGVVHATLGCESADTEILRLAKKGTTLGDYYAIDAMFRRCDDINLHCLWMLGLPGETPGSIQSTLSAMERLGQLPPNCGFATPYPGTQFYRDADHHGQIINPDWSTWSPKRVSFVPSGVDIETLQSANVEAQKICRRAR